MKALLRLYYLQSLLHGPRRGVDAEEGHLAGVASAAEPRVTRVARRSIAAAGGLAPHLSCQCLYAHAQTLFSSHFHMYYDFPACSDLQELSFPVISFL